MLLFSLILLAFWVILLRLTQKKRHLGGYANLRPNNNTNE